MSGNKNHLFRIFLISSYLLSTGLFSFSQTRIIQGIVTDNNSREPIPNVNIKINSTKEGVFTGRDGKFSLTLKRIPASLTISCVGYESLYYDIDKVPVKTVELVLRHSTSTLQEIDIRAMRFNYVFRDLNYSILDYEITDDKLLLLVFRYQLRHAELILLNMKGDTVSIAPVPEQKPNCFYKDFLGNIHYISTRGNAFQLYFNTESDNFEFPYTSTYEVLLKKIKPFLFSTGSRIYFQEFSPDGLGANFGYYDTAHHKQYIHTVQDDNARKNHSDDIRFYNHWNDAIKKNQQALTAPGISGTDNNPSSRDNSYIPLIDESDLRANKVFNYHLINAPLVKLGENSIAVLDFTDGVIDIMNEDGEIYRSLPIDFQKEANANPLYGLLSVFFPVADWEWSGKIYIDEYFRDVYTTFKKNGMVQIRKIDLGTGKLTRSFDMPFPFPKKIEIYKGDAYFLNKEIGGEFEKWKLIKLNL
jgi:hypothetical protein